jgi:hypothetical protein
MRTYQTITKTNIANFDDAVNRAIKSHRKAYPRLEHFQVVISSGFTTYYSGVVSWGRDDEKADSSDS